MKLTLKVRIQQEMLVKMISKRKVDEAKIKAPTVLTWIPGMIPVIAPHITPIKHANNISKI